MKYPTDSGLASSGVRVLAREGRKLRAADRRAAAPGCSTARGRWPQAAGDHADGPPALGEAMAEVLKLTEGRAAAVAVDHGGAALAVVARRKARGRGAKAKLKAAASLEEWADRCEKVARQIRKRVAGDLITDRIVSLSRPRRPADPQGQAGQAQRVRVRLAVGGGDREHQDRRPRIDPAGLDRAGQPARGHAPARHRRRAPTARDHLRRSRSRRFNVGPTNRALWTFSPSGHSSLAARSRAPNAPNADCGATGRVRRAASATSNAATGWTDPA